MNVIVLNIFEINYSQLIQYEILEKLVTFIPLPTAIAIADSTNKYMEVVLKWLEKDAPRS